jgi:hypothetical protein
MKLRTATIWTTWGMLLVTILAPYLAPAQNWEFGFQHTKISAMMIIPVIFYRLVSSLLAAMFFLLLTGSPLVVSLILAKKLKPFVIPSLLLFVSTIAYGIWFVSIWSQATDDLCCMSGIFVLYIVPSSLPVMIPVWVLALVVNSYYTKKVRG